MTLLVIRGDLQSHSGYSAAARDYCCILRRLFDRIVGVDIHFSRERPFEPFPYPLVTESQAQVLVDQAGPALVLSFTTPDHYRRYDRAVNVGLTFWETDRLPSQGQERPPWVDRANCMDALWLPSRHTEQVFRTAGVRVPTRVIPWPMRLPPPCPAGLPDGAVFDLDRQPFLLRPLAALTRLPAYPNRYWNALRGRLRPRTAQAALNRLRTWPHAIAAPEDRSLLCVAQDVPRKGLLLFLAEWLEFKRRHEAAPWCLILKTSPIDPRTFPFDFVMRFWEHVHALRHQLRVPQARVYLWAGDLRGPDYDRLVQNTCGVIAPSLGEGFCGPAALALALGKPLVAPRHTSLSDFIPTDHPYVYPTRPARLSFVADPIRMYDPASTWNPPVPFALADALSRLALDAVEQRHAAAERSRRHLLDWCGPERVAQLLAAEVQRLLGTTACSRAA